MSRLVREVGPARLAGPTGEGAASRAAPYCAGLSNVRLGSPDLESAEHFATACLGLQVAERGKKDLYLRSDDRAHTLCYSEGDPRQRCALEGGRISGSAP